MKKGIRIPVGLSMAATVVLVGLYYLTLGGCGSARESASGPPGTQEQGYFLTNVYFATDRAAVSDSTTRFAGTRGNGELTYGIVRVSIPDSHEVGEIESPAWYRIWGRDDPSKFVLVLDVTKFSGALVLADAVSNLLSEAGRDDILLFIHGYRNTFEDAAKRTAQLAYDLNFSGVPMFYSWPSGGTTAAYLADETSVEWTLPHFKEFLAYVLTDMGAENVHIIAHSMGNRALVKTLSELKPEDLPPGSANLSQIILAAPDIDAGVFRQLAENFPGKADRITLYTSARDKAIIASKEVHANPRAGGSIVVVDGVDTIDATEVNSGFLDHSYFKDSIVSDIFAIVTNDLDPSQRFGLDQQVLPEGVYWEMAPGAF